MLKDKNFALIEVDSVATANRIKHYLDKQNFMGQKIRVIIYIYLIKLILNMLKFQIFGSVHDNLGFTNENNKSYEYVVEI